jgi:Carbon dioxide concentrating mechanism/carboxysome shell protein
MQLAKVIGTVVSTRKEESLVGFKLLVVENLYSGRDNSSRQRVVVTDTLGAGIGDTILYVTGGAARVLYGNAPIDCSIVGIVDSTDIEE